jgi:hypothetical protein
MQDATSGSQDAPTAGYSLQEAAALLGIGVNTLRRRIAAGQVQAEQVQRPQGYVWRVYLEGRHPPTQPADDPPIQEATGSLPHPRGVPAQAEAMVSLIQTTIATVLGPLVGQLDAQRRTIERMAERHAAELDEQHRQAAKQAELIGAQRAELALLRAEVKALMASQSPPEASGAPESPEPAGEEEPPAPWWRFWERW